MDRVMQTFQFLRTAFIAVLFLCASVIANANIAGQVIMVKGNATAISADGTERTLQRRSDIHASDTIVTGSDSRVQIRFIDNALLALQEKSRLNIHEYNFAKESGESEKVLMELVEGGLRTLTGTIGKGNREAYTVNTPVASIGVRGTLYSVHLNGSQLSAGVWQGGIVIITPNGREINLGRDSSFSFGVFNNNNFRGLRTPPADLDAGDNNDVDTSNRDDSIPNNNGSEDDNNEPGENPDENPADNAFYHPLSAAAPNAFDQMDNQSKDTYVEQAGSKVGIIRSPVPELLSDAEFNVYTASNRHGVMVVNNKAVAGKFFNMPNSIETIFVVKNGTEFEIYRYSGNSAPLTGSSFNQSEFENILGHGTWGESGEPPVQFSSSQGSSNLNTSVSWLNAEIFKPSTQPSMDLLTINADVDSMTDSHGREGSAAMQMNLDLRSGSITAGNLTAAFSSQNNNTYWEADFEGGIDLLTGLMNLTFSNGLFEVSTGSNPAETGTFNTVNSNIGGFLIGDQDEMGFIGWFNLNGNLTGNDYFAGSYVFGEAESLLLADNEITQRIINFNLDRKGIAYAYINNELHIGAFIPENGKTSFVSLGNVGSANADYATLVARSNASFNSVSYGDNWGFWGEANNPVYIQSDTMRSGSSNSVPRVVTSIRFMDAIPFEFVPGAAGTFNFSTANQQYFGIDSFDNELSRVQGSFQYDAYSGGISNGDLTLNYGDSTTDANATNWVVNFSGGHENGGGRGFTLNNSGTTLTMGTSTVTLSADSYMEGFLVQGATPTEAKGALTAHQLNADNDIWASAVIQWINQSQP